MSHAPLVVTSASRLARERLAEVRIRAAQVSLYGALRWLWPVINPGKQLTAGYPIEAMCEAVEAYIRGDIRRLIINVVPGCGKSTITSRIGMVWSWIVDPTLRWLCLSHTLDPLSLELSRDRLNLIASPRYQALIPTHRDGRPKWGMSVTNIKSASNTMGGKFTIFSPTGKAPTGTHFDRHNYDDPHAVGDTQDAIAKAVASLTGPVASRFRNKAEASWMLTMQRVGVGDATDALAEAYPDAVRLTLPMEYDPGRHCDLRPHGLKFFDPRTKAGEMMPVHGMTPEVLEREKRKPLAYACEYQQTPISGEGNIFDARWWEPWHSLPVSGRLAGFIDATGGSERKGSSWLVIAVWYLHPGDKTRPAMAYLLDVLRLKGGWTVTESALLYMAQRWRRCGRWFIETKKIGRELYETYRKRMTGVRPYDPDGKGSKEDRAEAVAPLVRDGRAAIPTLRSGRPHCMAPAVDWRRPSQVPTECAELVRMCERGAYDDAVQAMLRFDTTASAGIVSRTVAHCRTFLAGSWGAPGWLDAWLDEHKAFPNANADDQVDTTTMALGPEGFGPQLEASAGVSRDFMPKGATRQRGVGGGH